MKWVNLEHLPAPFQFDIRYSRADNFMGEAVYPYARAFLLEHVAHDLMKVHAELEAHGFGILIFDGYRPLSVTETFWNRSTDEMRNYLADPKSGSVHNRGCAVDLSLYHLDSKHPAPMPSDFDELNEKAHVTFLGGDPVALANRDLLKEKMLKNGFTGIKHEWWHFNHGSAADFPVLNLSFEEMDLLVKQLR